MKKRIYKSPDGMSQINAGLWLYRGLPGSGKSTEAKKTAEEWGGFDFATDDYFTVDGEYRFDPSKLKEAHQWCQDETRAFLEAGKLVCVANTFSQLWEIKPYLDMANQLCVGVVVTHCCNDFGSIHNVPDHAIKRMRERWEHMPGENFIYPEDVMEELRYQILRCDLDYADNHRAYRIDDDWLKPSYEAIERQGCCGSFETKVKLPAGDTWMVGCNYGH